MSSLFNEDNRSEAKQDADLTLGIGSLLSIFFGIVLICGIFFGFGYSMGRRNAHSSSATSVAAPAEIAAAPVSVPESTPPSASSSGNTNHDSVATAKSQPATPKAALSQDNSADETLKRALAQAKPVPALSAAPAPPQRTPASRQHTGIKAPLEQAEGDASLVEGHPIMVQIAAISRQSDADVLANALRQRGFTPSVHPGTTDHLFHVQIGPFSSKAQAEAVKQRLLSDGYNAILK